MDFLLFLKNIVPNEHVFEIFTLAFIHVKFMGIF
jgi:hypothetical protein